jgi:uncharacterized protein (DUF427 family)
MIRRVADFPRPPAIEPVPDTIRIVLGGQEIAATQAAWRIMETTHPPTYYLPAGCFLPGVLTPSRRTSFCEWKGVANYVSLRAGDRVEHDAGWLYRNPSPDYAALRDHVAVYAGRMDACFVGAEQVVPQPGGFYGGWITAAFEGPFKGGPGTQFW